MEESNQSIELNIKVVNGQTATIRFKHIGITVLELKQIIQQQMNIHVENQRLIFQGQIMQDNKNVEFYKIKNGYAIHLAEIKSTITSSSSSPPTRASSATNSTNDLSRHIETLRQGVTTPQYTTAISTLQKICNNIIQNPNEEKYRKLRTTNAAMQEKLLNHPGGIEMLKAIGFQDSMEQDHLVLVPTEQAWSHLLSCKQLIDTQAIGSSFPSMSSLGSGLPTVPLGGNGMGDIDSMIQMLENPMMQQMMANDPMIRQMSANNPMMQQVFQNPAMMRQSLQMMQNNPMMRNQIQQMMNNPSMMNQMQQQMMGIRGNINNIFPPAPPASTGLGNSNPFLPTNLNNAASGVNRNPFLPSSNFPHPSSTTPSSTAPTSTSAATPTSSTTSTPAPTSTSAATPTSSTTPTTSTTTTASISSNTTRIPSSNTNSSTTENSFDDTEDQEIMEAIMRSLHEQ